jgi:hypothetical protein
MQIIPLPVNCRDAIHREVRNKILSLPRVNSLLNIKLRILAKMHIPVANVHLLQNNSDKKKKPEKNPFPFPGFHI